MNSESSKLICGILSLLLSKLNNAPILYKIVLLTFCIHLPGTIFSAVGSLKNIYFKRIHIFFICQFMFFLKNSKKRPWGYQPVGLCLSYLFIFLFSMFQFLNTTTVWHKHWLNIRLVQSESWLALKRVSKDRRTLLDNF